MEINKDTIEAMTIYKVIVGSRAYGMSTPASDMDYSGIAIAPLEYYLGTKNFEQYQEKVDGKDDMTIFDIRKFFKLAMAMNPNVIELLFIDDPELILKCHPVMEELKANRNLFLSQKCAYTYTGYAISQLHRIRTHRGWLLNGEIPKPSRKDYGLPETQDKILSSNELSALNKIIRGRVEEIIEEYKDSVKTIDGEDPYETFRRNEGQSVNTALSLVLSENNIILPKSIMEVVKRENRYRSDLQHHKQWEVWKATRNPKRSELEAKFGYDCYSDDTEFLTENGWQFYKDIKNTDKLATLFVNMSDCAMTHKRNFGIEYQNYIDKFDGIYNGCMYNLIGKHTDVLVTPNHKMFVENVERESNKSHGWSLTEMAHMPDTFNILNRINYRVRNFKQRRPLGFDPRLYLQIMGFYISEGSVAHYLNNGDPSILSISQLKGGKVHSLMNVLRHYWLRSIKINEYCHYRKSKNRYEMTWTIPHRELAKTMTDECGIGSRNKKIPRWVFSMSKRMMDYLLRSLLAGDGTVKKYQDSYIYYTSSKQLANDVQELAFHCGYGTSLYGPYTSVSQNGIKCDMYQVYINKGAVQKRLFVRSNAVRKINVKDQKIVCFTVPNGILITRRNGHIGIHGNSKHASHLVRLLRSGYELLTTGILQVERPDAKELLEIRNGAWSYDKLIDYATNMENNIMMFYNSKQSPLPHHPDSNRLCNFCTELVKEFHYGN